MKPLALLHNRFALAGMGVAIAAGGATGVTLAAHASSAPASATIAAASTSTTTSTGAPEPTKSPTTTAPGGKGAHRAHHDHLLLGRLVSVTSTQLSYADAGGAVHVVGVGPKTRALNPSGTQEALTAIPVGDIVRLVVVTHHDHPKGAPATGSSSSSSSTSTSSTGTGTGATPAAPMVALVADTGFAAAH